MPRSRPKKTLYNAYRFPGFTAEREVKGRFGDQTALVIRLTRRSKKLRAGLAALSVAAGTTAEGGTSATYLAGIAAFTLKWISVESSDGSATP